MESKTGQNMHRSVLTLLFAAALASVALSQDASRRRGTAPYIVHEWGTFTTIADADGGSRAWRPLAGKDDLPGFVHRIGDRDGERGIRTRNPNQRKFGKREQSALVRMETPVLYFYAKRSLDARIRVDFPQGVVTEWYPHASSVGNHIDWGRVEIQPHLQPRLPRERAPSHYYPAREVGAAPVVVSGSKGNEVDKLLFYRGVAWFKLPIRVRLAGGKVHVETKTAEDLIRFIVFENRGGKKAYGVYALVGEKSEHEIDRPVGGDAIVWPEIDHRGALERLLRLAGLTGVEAKAMLRTWDDQWFEEGLRVFWIVPRAFTDRVLPIRLSPRPKELVRVMVGRVEILTPEMQREVLAQVPKLESGRKVDRDAALAALRRWGRFAEPVLEPALRQRKKYRLLLDVRKWMSE